MKCPICQSSEFQDSSNRKNSRCKSCKAMERTRLLYKVLDKYKILKPNIKILHIEPEPALRKIFTQISPDNYFPFSIDPNNYKNQLIYNLEYPEKIKNFSSQSFDLIIHNHFLERIPLPVNYSLKIFSEILRNGGHHLFTTFIGKGLTKEGLEKISNEERIKKFGQIDRFYKFGTNDFIPLLQDLWGCENVYVKNQESFSIQEYLDAALPEKLFEIITPSTIFFQKK